MKNIYLITNKVNGMKYVGKTKQTIHERLKQHKWVKSKTYMHKAICEFGIENFDIKLVCEVEDDEALTVEKYYTKLYNTVYPNGYNEMLGQSLKGGNNKMKGKHLPALWRLHCSRPKIQNGRAKYYVIKFLDTNEVVKVELRYGICNYLHISLSTVKKWLNKEHIDHISGRPIIFYSIGGINNG